MDVPIITRTDQYYAYIAGKNNGNLPKPITREEMYLAYLANGTGYLPKPITRKEKYLSIIAGMSKEEMPEPITRKEMYLAYWAGKDNITLPSPITREEMFLYEAVNTKQVEFHLIDENGNLVIIGAFSTKSYDDGLYLDCEPGLA